MTTGTKHVPQHGGLQRVAFNGGQTVRGELSFNATSVNIDNWSPYWYKLNPIEEYIPPFQHGINVRLPLIHSYEFVCQSPPGIEQTIIIPTTGIPGNDKPLIAVFSSYDTNNDAGFSALEASSNKPSGFVPFNGITAVDVDLTLYDGFYLDMIAGAQLLLLIEDIDPVFGITVTYNRVVYGGMRLFLVIPKVSRIVRVLFSTDPNRIVAILGSYILRPFIGPLPFSATIMPKVQGAVSPRDLVSTVGETSIVFTTLGIDNAVLTVTPNGGAGVTNNTIYWIKVFANSYSAVGPLLLYSKTFLNPVNLAGFVLPIGGILSRQIDSITVFIRPSEAGVNLPTAVTELALHQNTPESLDSSNFDTPHPLVVRGAFVTIVGTALAVTLPIGSMLKSAIIAIYVPVAGSVINIGIGNGAGVIQFFGDAPGVVAGQYEMLHGRPLRTDNGFNSFWFNSNAAGVTFTFALSFD